MLAFGATLPAAHGDGSVAPVLHEEPLGHAWHSLCALSPLALPYEPSSQSVRAVAPSVQKPPWPQELQLNCPSSACMEPGSHLTQ